VIHRDRLSELPTLVEPLQEKQVVLFADEAAFQALQGSYPDDLLHRAEPEHFGTEFLSLKMSVKTVSSLDEALEHIAHYSSRHSEAIIATDPETTATFLKRVDAAVVYANTSTAFTDGAQFGLGAEIGISTQKLHARGPMALKELTTYKWIIEGNGQVRPV
jgi:glutamate-5-semialdehyde dehydrogenase